MHRGNEKRLGVTSIIQIVEKVIANGPYRVVPIGNLRIPVIQGVVAHSNNREDIEESLIT